MGFRTLDFGVGRFLHCVDGFWIVDFRFGRFLPSLVLIDPFFLLLGPKSTAHSAGHGLSRRSNLTKSMGVQNPDVHSRLKCVCERRTSRKML